MTNPANAIRMLITYALCIPLAILVGYLLTDPLQYGSMGVFGLIALLLMSPIFIRWHYPIMVFALWSPVYCFFIKGDPPLPQVMVILSFSLAIIERTINSERRFISPAVMAWPFLYTAGVVYMTAKLTGGIGLRAMGGGEEGGVGGGKKYIEIFVGIATFFALTSRAIPREKRNLYIALYFLAGLPAFIGDLFPLLPGPLKYINLLIPPTSTSSDATFSLGGRLSAFASSIGCIAIYLLVRHGLRGIFMEGKHYRAVIFCVGMVLTLTGGFRTTLITNGTIILILFFLEGLHRTRLLLVFGIMGITGAAAIVPLAKHLPDSFQRTLTIFPLDLDPQVRMDAEGSKQWRYDMWSDLWPKVPGYLLLGKGYALTAEDYQFMGGGQFAFTQSLDKSATGLAVSGDYHSGPLSTLIPFGVWGAISIVWLMAAGVFVTYRNYRNSDPDILPANRYLFVIVLWNIIFYFFLFGAYTDEIFVLGKTIGFSIALNCGVKAAKRIATATRPMPTVIRRRMRIPEPKAA